MQIKIEHFTARRTLLFYLPEQNMPAAVFATPKQPSESALIQSIVNLGSVIHCLLTPTLLAVKYAQNANPADIQALTLAELDENAAQIKINEPIRNLPLEAETLEAVTDAFIRPTLFRDNGDVEIIDCKDNILTLRFCGHCAGCPYAQNTLNNVIMRVFRKYFPQITDVRMTE